MKKIIFLVLLSAVQNAFALQMSCVGTEPFWSVDVKDESVVYSSPDSEETMKGITFKEMIVTDAAGISPLNAFTVSALDEAEENAIELSVIRSSTSCSDGMSETEFSHHALVKVQDMLLSGCCQVSE